MFLVVNFCKFRFTQIDKSTMILRYSSRSAIAKVSLHFVFNLLALQVCCCRFYASISSGTETNIPQDANRRQNLPSVSKLHNKIAIRLKERDWHDTMQKHKKDMVEYEHHEHLRQQAVDECVSVLLFNLHISSILGTKRVSRGTNIDNKHPEFPLLPTHNVTMSTNSLRRPKVQHDRNEKNSCTTDRGYFISGNVERNDYVLVGICVSDDIKNNQGIHKRNTD